MLRYLVILLLLVGLAPVVPSLVEARLGASDRTERAEREREREDGEERSGPRRHRISVDRRGHYVADAYLNGRGVDMLVDTGATLTALPASVASDIGIFLSASDYKHPIGTANGTVYGARAVIDKIKIGAIRFRNVDAIILKDDSLGVPLLGMSALGQLKRFDISSGTLVLVQ